jgi:hypothetical protein
MPNKHPLFLRELYCSRPVGFFQMVNGGWMETLVHAVITAQSACCSARVRALDEGCEEVGLFCTKCMVSSMILSRPFLDAFAASHTWTPCGEKLTQLVWATTTDIATIW